MQQAELLALPRPMIQGYLQQHGLDRSATPLVVSICEELKRLRGGEAILPAPAPGLMQLQLVAEGE